MSNFFRFLTSKTFFINLLIALLLVAGGLYGTMNYLDTFTLHGKTIRVPDLIGHNISETDSLLMENSEFTTAVADSFYEKGVKAGKILEQNPSANTTVKQGRKIYLTVASYSAPKVSMPNLVDMSLRQATSLMETFGLTIGELSYQPNLCVNCILAQKINGEEVEAGQKVPKGETIDFVVGQGLGNELATVPYLIEFKLSMAKDLLTAKALNVGSVIYDSETVQTAEDSAMALVYKQIPAYSENPSVRMGSSVDLFLTADTNSIKHSVNPDSLR